MTGVLLSAQPISALLHAPLTASRLTVGPELRGFGGAHGGLALALLTARMRAEAQGRSLRRVSARFKRPLRDEFVLVVSDEPGGKTTSWLSAEARVSGAAVLSAEALFAEASRSAVSPVAPPMPAAPPPADCPVFALPTVLVPFAHRTQIRPVGPVRPFTGAAEPELLAWLRLVDDDVPPDDLRLIILMDSLAPSYAAVLDVPVPIPTVTFSVLPGAGLARASSPWILLRARTAVASTDAWLLERLDAWGPDGDHLGSAEQLRTVLSP